MTIMRMPNKVDYAILALSEMAIIGRAGWDSSK
jgi:hypothetical protein